MLKIGELADRTGLTVRTLHHYDRIGLLVPSARSDAGYRLYDRDDLARLHQILALRGFGMALADIGAYLDRPEASPLALIDRQLAALGQQIEQARRARTQLQAVRDQLARGESPDLAVWLTTLETMHMYEKYFTKEELAQLPLYRDPDTRAQWRALVGEVQAALARAVGPCDEDVLALAERWLVLLERSTAGNQDWQVQLDLMNDLEPEAQRETGITPELKAFMVAAMGEVRLRLYARYLPEDAVAHMRRHQAGRVREWHPLTARIRARMQADPAAATLESRDLAREWQALFIDMVGPDSAVIPAFREAVEREPLLRVARGMSDQMVAWLRSALAT